MRVLSTSTIGWVHLELPGVNRIPQLGLTAL
jgi:hypothetical protein